MVEIWAAVTCNRCGRRYNFQAPTSGSPAPVSPAACRKIAAAEGWSVPPADLENGQAGREICPICQREGEH